MEFGAVFVGLSVSRSLCRFMGAFMFVCVLAEGNVSFSLC